MLLADSVEESVGAGMALPVLLAVAVPVAEGMGGGVAALERETLAVFEGLPVSVEEKETDSAAPLLKKVLVEPDALAPLPPECAALRD